MYCGNVVLRNQAVVILYARLRPLVTALRHRMVHVGCTRRRKEARPGSKIRAASSTSRSGTT